MERTVKWAERIERREEVIVVVVFRSGCGGVHQQARGQKNDDAARRVQAKGEKTISNPPLAPSRGLFWTRILSLIRLLLINRLEITYSGVHGPSVVVQPKFLIVISTAVNQG
jgi:hypothetical protein